MNIIDKINWSLFWGILAGIIVIAVAIAQWSEKKKEETKSELNQKKADTAQAELKSIQLENLEKTNELAQAYKQIASLQDELKNEITGGDSKPILIITKSKILTHNASQKKYFIIFFDILNNSDYAIQNVKASVNDIHGMDMLKYGIKIIREGLVYREIKPSVNDYINYNPANQFDKIGSISKNTKYSLYTTTYCQELSKSNPHFSVELNWFNGHFTYFINLKAEGETINFDSAELVYNGTMIDYNKYLKLEKF